jgi:dihydroorotate dehydrogenase (fumarate)
MVLSNPSEMKLPLRWIALLYSRINASLALNTGAHSGEDVAKAILAGATVIQTASALLQNGIPYLSTMLRELEGWMDARGYDDLESFRGKMSQKEIDDPFAFERAQYIKLLMRQK